MANTPVQFYAPSGLSLTLELYAHGSDVLANSGGDAAVEKTNCKGLYEATVAEALAGLFDAVIKSGTDVVANYHVELADDTAIHRCGDWPVADVLDAAVSSRSSHTAADVRTEMDANSVKLANLDATVSSRFASADYVPPDNATVADTNARVTALQAILSGITNLAHWLRAMLRKDAANATAKAEINAGGGAYNEATDSLEAQADAGVGASAAEVWSYGQRTLTMSAAQIAAIVSGSSLTLHRGDTLTIAITGLGDISDRSQLWITGKNRSGDSDEDSQFQVEETEGLLVLVGETPEDDETASIVVDDETAGDITITISAAASKKLVPTPASLWPTAASAKLSPVPTSVWDVQVRDVSGVVRTLAQGGLRIVADITQRIE